MALGLSGRQQLGTFIEHRPDVWPWGLDPDADRVLPVPSFIPLSVHSRRADGNKLTHKQMNKTLRSYDSSWLGAAPGSGWAGDIQAAPRRLMKNSQENQE